MIEKIPIIGRSLRHVTKSTDPIRRHRLSGYQAFVELMAKLERSKPKRMDDQQPVYVYFTGTRLPETGENWCPMCTTAEPLVKAALQGVKYRCDFVRCEVGDREFWEDPKNGFRTNRHTHLLQLPTLLRWKTEKRLEGKWVVKPEMLVMFFERDL